MNKELMEELKRLMGHFPKSFINHDFEMILIPKTNTYFILEDCRDKRDIVAKLLMWCSRTIRKCNRDRLNRYLGTNFSGEDMDLIYQKLGNAIRKELTYEFIDSGFDMGVLDN